MSDFQASAGYHVLLAARGGAWQSSSSKSGFYTLLSGSKQLGRDCRRSRATEELVACTKVGTEAETQPVHLPSLVLLQGLY